MPSLYLCSSSLPQVPTSTSPSSSHLVLSIRQRWPQAWISMEQLWASPPHYMASHKCTNSQYCTQDYLCLMVRYLSIPIPARFGDCCSARSDPCHDQAPRIANPSEKSLSKYTFGGLREILGYMWGVRQFRWTQRDILPKSVGHRIIHIPSPTLDRSSKTLVSQLSARPQRIR